MELNPWGLSCFLDAAFIEGLPEIDYPMSRSRSHSKSSNYASLFLMARLFVILLAIGNKVKPIAQ
jgi:hypothetical protein